MTIEDIERAVAKLPPDQLAEFRAWLRSLTPLASIKRSSATPVPAGSIGWPNKLSAIWIRPARASYELFSVIARSESDEAIQLGGSALDCFAIARNDEAGNRGVYRTRPGLNTDGGPLYPSRPCRTSSSSRARSFPRSGCDARSMAWRSPRTGRRRRSRFCSCP